MTDPAVEAAQRAWDALQRKSGWGPEEIPQELAAAAREALKPIRELYEQMNSPLPDGFELPGGVKYLLERLAPLIFTTEELGL